MKKIIESARFAKRKVRRASAAWFLAMAWYEVAAVWALVALRPRWLGGGGTAD